MKRIPSFLIPRLPSFLALPILAACTTEKRHEIWRTLDPAGYKHAHSEVFNPKKYKREAPRESSEDLRDKDITL